MKSKIIPADIKFKSIKEAQSEIKEIITNLEDSNTNLEESMDKYNRMMHLNEHIRRQFQKEIKEIRKSNINKKKNTSIKD